MSHVESDFETRFIGKRSTKNQTPSKQANKQMKTTKWVGGPRALPWAVLPILVPHLPFLMIVDFGCFLFLGESSVWQAIHKYFPMDYSMEILASDQSSER